VLTAEEYAVLMYRCGFVEQRVALNVVAHELPSRSDVIEWVKGTLLTGYQRRMSPALFAHFLAVYEDHLFDVLPDERPFFYPFKRILMWGRR
jgi:trans-aconitate 2-methyltransferase